MTPLYDLLGNQQMGNQRLGIVLLISALALLVSLLSSIFLGFLYSKRKSVVVTESPEHIQLKDILNFPLILWLIFFTCATFYCSFFPFISLSKVFFMSKYGFQPSEAGQLTRYV